MAQINDKQLSRLEALVLSLQELVESLRGKDVQLSPELVEHIDRFRSEGRCLYCELPLTGKVSRGCHAACYVLLTRRIKGGEITRAEVIAKGWMDPRTEPSGRKPKRPDPMRGRSGKPPVSPEARAEAEKMKADLADKLKKKRERK